MNQCIMTKLKESVEDNSLLKLGELRINIDSEENPTSGTRGIKLESTVDQTISIIEGDAHFTDSTLATDKGKTLNLVANTTSYIYISNSKCVLSIPNKYALSMIYMHIEGKTESHKAFSFDIANLLGCTELKYLYLSSSACYGDIKGLSTSTKLIAIYIFPMKTIYGDIAALKNCTELTVLSAQDTNVSGDISSIKTCTNLITIELTNTKVNGNIGELGTLTNMDNLSISNTFISGSISNLSTCTNLEYLNVKHLQLSGDLSLMPSKMCFISNAYGTSTFTWQNTRANSSRILAMENINLGQYVDAMLINQANCSAYNPGSDAWFKTISVSGNKTSSSDNAVTTLGTKGYTVVVA